MWTDIALTILGLVLIVAGANYLTDGAAALARRFKIPQLIIGFTIVAFGTSAPELSLSVIGSIEGNGGIAVGNVIGSNIFNIFFVRGVASSVNPLRNLQFTTLDTRYMDAADSYHHCFCYGTILGQERD